MSKNSKPLVLLLAGVLIFIGVVKPDLSSLNIFRPNPPAPIDVLELAEPTDPTVRDKCVVVIDALRKGGSDRHYDGKRLRDLYLDLAKLIAIDGTDTVIKNTEELRQANKIAGTMLRLDIKGKYADLAKATTDVLVTAIGDDMVLLSPALRAKAVDAFNALAWATNEGSK